MIIVSTHDSQGTDGDKQEYEGFEADPQCLEQPIGLDVNRCQSNQKKEFNSHQN